MDTSRISQLSSIFGSRLSRRNTVKYAGLGLGMAGLGARALSNPVAAQDATPTTDPGLPEGERTYFMFIQTARSGTWAPKAGEDGTYTLTLSGLPAQTVYFSDRPERIVGTQTTVDFLKALGFTADNPPNAALVTSNQGDDDVLVIELFNPVYTEGEDGATLVYDARILESYVGTGLGNVAQEQDDKILLASFDGASLFIDDCPDIVNCYYGINPKPIGPVPGAPIGTCYSWKKGLCQPCNGQSTSYYDNLCAITYPKECGNGACGVWVL